MSIVEGARYATAACLSLVLAWAAYHDIRSRRIPNPAVLAVLALFVVWCVLNGGQGLVSSLEAAGVALVVTGALYAAKIVGAGDSKLFTAVALFAGLGLLLTLAIATSFMGGVIAVISLISRPRRALVMWTLRGKGDWGRGVPYGVAIAFGAAFVVWGTLVGALPAFGGMKSLTVQDLTAFVQR